jgi:hypothetical protein
MHVGWESSKNYSLVLVRFINLLSFEMFYIKGESNGIGFVFFFFFCCWTICYQIGLFSPLRPFPLLKCFKKLLILKDKALNLVTNGNELCT